MLHCYQMIVKFLTQKIYIYILANCFHNIYFILQFVPVSNLQFNLIHIKLTYFPSSFTYLISTISFDSSQDNYKAAGNGEGTETYIMGVSCEVFSVENCNGKHIKTYLE